ncbi:MAG: YfiR family protein, partial [Planctomycetota bacterium]
PIHLYVPSIHRLTKAFANQKRKTVGRRTLQLHALPTSTPPEAGSVVFITSDTSPEQIQAILAACKGRPILTIGESNGMAQAGCMINFVKVGKKLRFEVNLDACREGGLKLSSELLKLARIVKPQEGGQ